MPPPPLVFLVIPCFNESRRLPAFLKELLPELSPLGESIKVQIVDDGSSTDEQRKLGELISELRVTYPSLCSPLFRQHEGKGGAILEGWEVAPPNTDYYAFVDADGAISPSEVARVTRHVQSQGNEEITFFAVRRTTPTTKVTRHPLRKIVGLIYYQCVNIALGTRVSDPACGFKLLPRSFYRTCGALLTERQWALDIEILARIQHHGFPLEEIPVSWTEKGGSKIRQADTFRIFRSLFRIHRRSREW